MEENRDEMKEIRKAIKDFIESQKKTDEEIKKLTLSQKKTDSQIKNLGKEIGSKGIYRGIRPFF